MKSDGFSESVKKLTTLRSLCLYSTYREETLTLPQLMSFSDHMNLYHLSLEGRLEKFPDEIEFYPPNLIYSELESNGDSREAAKIENSRLIA